VRRLAGDVRIPARSTVHAVLDRHGLVKRARQRGRNKATATPLSAGLDPNDVWCADYKGEFKLGNGKWCYPLTVKDHASRRILMAEAHPDTKDINALDALERLFKEQSLPRLIRTDNGLPFASPNYTLSKLSVYWLRLEISLERVKPGCPQQNGRHERMHLTLKKETTPPPAMNVL
jgi:transposase InsO family protein